MQNMASVGWKCAGKTRWWSQKLTGKHNRLLICPSNRSLVWAQVWIWVHVCLQETRNTPGTENRPHFTPPARPAPSAGSELRMNNGWIQLCWNRNTFRPRGKANSQSQTTTFEHLQLRKLRDGIFGWLISQAAEWDKTQLLDIAECFTNP